LYSINYAVDLCVALVGGVYVVGRYCEYGRTYCQLTGNAACQNGATCVNKEDGYVCLCAPGYSGQLDSLFYIHTRV